MRAPQPSLVAAAACTAAAIASVVAAVTAMSPARCTVHADGPPIAHTGGFGEPNCRRCHFDQPLNNSPGRLRLSGLPATYQPARRYRLGVSLQKAGMLRSGFQVSARFADGRDSGRQAGSLRAIDERVSATADSASGVQYAQHTRLGTALAAGDSTRWFVEWTAPSDAVNAVIFHVAANAANGDDSELGDFVYARSVIVKPRRREK